MSPINTGTAPGLLNSAIHCAVFATSGLALEKTAARMSDDTRAGDWNAGTTCSVAYYNTCTGWVWVWSGYSPNDVVGVCFDNCCLPNHGFVTSNWAFVWTAAPAGYGFTGTIAVSDADADAFYTTKNSGIGMGLSICKTIVSAHGGQISCILGETRGATFSFSLPAYALSTD